jgi:tetratricopeptide (TPR) repeat protein
MTILTTLSWTSAAKQRLPSVQIDRYVTIVYNSEQLNIDSSKVNSASLIFRDANSGRMANFQLEETGPDTSKFVGRFAITWADTSVISPEIYVPSPEKAKSKEIFDLVATGKIQRKPILVEKDEKENRTILVFDSREQAENERKIYEEKVRLSARKLLKPVPSDQSLEAAKQAEHLAELDRLKSDAVLHESERIRLEQLERQRAEANLKKFQALPLSEQTARIEKAKRVLAEAMAAYNAGKYLQAEAKFKESIDLNPSDKSPYFRYGVSLYRIGKNNQAIVALRMAPDDKATNLEKKYFLGLVHLKLNEIDQAQTIFQEVGRSKDPVLAPSALFYEGALLFSQEKFEEAKAPFEQVIDTSQDPKLDAQAEDYIEKIASALQYKAMREKKWNVTGVVGVFYDSNVLLTPESQPAAATASKEGDIRLLTLGTLEYRPVFNEHHEWSVKGTANITNSSNPNLSLADPWIYTFEAPYSYKGILWNKGFKFSARPGYEMLYMAVTANAPKTDLINSPYIAADATFVMKPTWFATYSVQYRRDNSFIAYTTPGDNLTANQFSLRTQQMFLIDKSKQEAFIAMGGIVRNDADGDNKIYNRFEIGSMYVHPIKSFGWNVALNYYYLSFPSASLGREDNDLTISTGISKPLKEWFTWGLTASYADNISTQDTYVYTKLTIMTTATFNTLF